MDNDRPYLELRDIRSNNLYILIRSRSNLASVWASLCFGIEFGTGDWFPNWVKDIVLKLFVQGGPTQSLVSFSVSMHSIAVFSSNDDIRLLIFCISKSRKIQYIIEWLTNRHNARERWMYIDGYGHCGLCVFVVVQTNPGRLWTLPWKSKLSSWIVMFTFVRHVDPVSASSLVRYWCWSYVFESWSPGQQTVDQKYWTRNWDFVSVTPFCRSVC